MSIPAGATEFESTHQAGQASRDAEIASLRSKLAEAEARISDAMPIIDAAQQMLNTAMVIPGVSREQQEQSAWQALASARGRWSLKYECTAREALSSEPAQTEDPTGS